jgi:hypothetical protein
MSSVKLNKRPGTHVGRGGKGAANEINYPYVVELSVVRDGLDIDLSRQIMQFHKSRHIQPQYGRRIRAARGNFYYRWCFSDVLTAHAFVEQFGGEFCKI